MQIWTNGFSSCTAGVYSDRAGRVRKEIKMTAQARYMRIIRISRMSLKHQLILSYIYKRNKGCVNPLCLIFLVSVPTTLRGLSWLDH